MQNSAVDFINYVVEKFPFRIKVISTDNGYEFQPKFHWHIEDYRTHLYGFVDLSCQVKLEIDKDIYQK
jgi:hypothetical protein